MARALTQAGVDCYVCPMFAPEPSHQKLPDDCFDKVIFVSEHAVSYADRDKGVLANALADMVQWYAIGPATAAALGAFLKAWKKPKGTSHGSQDLTAAPDLRVPELARSEGLLALPELQAQALQNGQKVLLIAGEGGRELIADTLTARGARVTTWLVYKRVPSSMTMVVETLRNLQPELDVCVASSGAGLELLARAWFAAGGGAEVPVCVPSPRILQLAKDLGWQTPVLCNGAGAEATLKGLVDAGLLNADKES